VTLIQQELLQNNNNFYASSYREFFNNILKVLWIFFTISSNRFFECVNSGRRGRECKLFRKRFRLECKQIYICFKKHVSVAL